MKTLLVLLTACTALLPCCSRPIDLSEHAVIENVTTLKAGVSFIKAGRTTRDEVEKVIGNGQLVFDDFDSPSMNLLHLYKWKKEACGCSDQEHAAAGCSIRIPGQCVEGTEAVVLSVQYDSKGLVKEISIRDGRF